jgi:hypothetical protein
MRCIELVRLQRHLQLLQRGSDRSGHALRARGGTHPLWCTHEKATWRFSGLSSPKRRAFLRSGAPGFESGPETSRRIIAQFVEKQQRAGRLRESDPHQSATLFHDMITFDLLHRAMLGNKPTDDEIRYRIDAAIDAFLRGFART